MKQKSASVYFDDIFRFNQDLDFSLLQFNTNFVLESYLRAIQKELHSFGFDVAMSEKENCYPVCFFESKYETAFIKDRRP